MADGIVNRSPLYKMAAFNIHDKGIFRAEQWWVDEDYGHVIKGYKLQLVEYSLE